MSALKATTFGDSGTSFRSSLVPSILTSSPVMASFLTYLSSNPYESSASMTFCDVLNS